MSRDELALFREVFERRSFTAAARSLGLDPSVVSRRLRGLEQRLGTALFLRTTRAVSPTEAGTALYERVAPALDTIAEAELDVASGASVLRGVVRVAAPGALGRLRVAPIAHTFAEAHPEVQLHLLLSDRRLDLVREGVDVAVRVGASRDAGFVGRRLGPSVQWAVASPAYLARSPGFDRGFAGHHLVLRIEDGALIDLREQLPEPVREAVTVGFVSDDVAAAADAVSRGLGVGVLPSWLVADDVARGHLVRLPLDRHVEVPVTALLPAGRRATRRARVFVDALVAGWGAAAEPRG